MMIREPKFPVHRCCMVRHAPFAPASALIQAFKQDFFHILNSFIYLLDFRKPKNHSALT